jgi:predicted nucleic acid-binding protein
LNFTCRRSVITIRSTVDLLIAETAIENNVYLLHNDNDFNNLAGIVPELKIYEKI